MGQHQPLTDFGHVEQFFRHHGPQPQPSQHWRLEKGIIKKPEETSDAQNNGFGTVSATVFPTLDPRNLEDNESCPRVFGNVEPWKTKRFSAEDVGCPLQIAQSEVRIGKSQRSCSSIKKQINNKQKDQTGHFFLFNNTSTSTVFRVCHWVCLHLQSIWGVT